MGAPASDLLARFYTKSDVGELLIRLMPKRRPKSFIDLGAGEGSLSAAAVSRWSKTRYVTVDIDVSTSDLLCAKLNGAGGQTHVHHVQDVLDPDLPDLIFAGDNFDTSVTNPPYLKPEWRPGFEKILNRAGLADALASKSDVSADILFLAQSIRLTKPGGTIGLILPDALVTGRQFKDLRSVLMRQHAIRSVVQLPRSSFKGTEAQAFILLLERGSAGARKVALQRFDRHSGLSRPLFIDADAAEHRLDYNFHSATMVSVDGATLKDVGAVVTRGTVNATEARRVEMDIFHTSHFSEVVDGEITFRYDHASKPTGSVIAEPGDILLARIDRKLEQKIGIVAGGSSVISDCVYRIRVPAEARRRVLEAMCSDVGRSLIAAAARGVGARLIGKAELLSIPFQMCRTDNER